MRDHYPQILFDGLLDFQQSGIAVLQHFSGVQIDEMVMLPELVRTFVLGAVVAELVFDHQIAVQEQLDGVVKGGSADTVFVVFHLVVQLLNVEMPMGGVYFLQDRISLRGFP